MKPWIGIALLLLSASVHCQEFRTLDLGKIYRDAETIKTMQAERAALEAQQRAYEAEARAHESEARAHEAEVQAHASRQPPFAPPLDVEPAFLRLRQAMNVGLQRYPDFRQTALDPDLKVTDDMGRFIGNSRYAVELMYFLGKHPDESAAISMMSLPDMARRLTQIEMQIKAEQPKNALSPSAP